MSGTHATRRAFAAGLGLTAAACATHGPFAPPVMVNFAVPAVPPPDGPISLSTDIDAGLRMTVPVTVEGSGPYPFVVDTGANRSAIAAELAGALALRPGPSANIHGIAGVEPAATVNIRRLTVGGLTTQHLRLPTLSRGHLGAQGLLGVDVLKGRRVVLDFHNNRLDIAPSSGFQVAAAPGSGRLRVEAAPDPSVVVVPARQRFGQLTIVDADVGGLAVTAFIDSGSQVTVGNLALRDLVLRNPALAAQTVVVQLVSVTGQQIGGQLAPLPGLRLGGLRIGNLSAVFADLHTFAIWELEEQPAILVGVDLLRHFESVELDFGRRLVTFRTPKTAPG